MFIKERTSISNPCATGAKAAFGKVNNIVEVHKRRGIKLLLVYVYRVVSSPW